MKKAIEFDKASWGNGPWVGEADQVEWIDPATGFPCFITRGPVGSWCGYVAVPKTHPYFRASYDDPEVDVHGGLTYGAESNEYIGHEGRTEEEWWFGFDCAHCNDLTPHTNARMRMRGENPFPGQIYRTQAYVTAQVTSLAKQLHELRDKIRNCPTCGAEMKASE